MDPGAQNDAGPAPGRGVSLARATGGPRRVVSAQVGAIGPGLLTAGAVAAVAWVAGQAVPLVGPAVFAIALGLLTSILGPSRSELEPGLRFCTHTVLKCSIVLLGVGLSLGQIGAVGRATLPVLVVTLVVGLVGSAVIGRALGLPRKIRTLIGVGTSICGASAIAAAAASIDAEDEDVAPAIWTIFTFNIAAVAVFPLVGHLLGMSQHAFGVWAGTAVNDTSSVTAVAYSYGPVAGADAVVVKLTRTLAIVPICIGLAMGRVASGRAAGGSPRIAWRQVVPFFLVGFVVAVALNTAGWIPDGWQGGLEVGARFMITMAMAAVGLSIDWRALRRTSYRPLVLGALIWALVAVTALGLISVQVAGWNEGGP